MARPGRWSRTWTGILAPVRSRKSPCPAAGLRKGSLLAVVLALQVLGLPVPDHVFGVAIPVATTGFPQPVRPLCYDEGVLVRVCSRIGGRPHLAARRGGGAGRASAQGPGRCRRVCWQHLDQPALVPTVAAGVPSWHISAPALLVDAGRSDAGGPASRGRSRPPRRPGRLGALPGQRQLGHQQRAGQPGRDGHQTSSSVLQLAGLHGERGVKPASLRLGAADRHLRYRRDGWRPPTRWASPTAAASRNGSASTWPTRPPVADLSRNAAA